MFVCLRAMQLRIERAAQAGQHALAEQELHTHVGELLDGLSRLVVACAPAFAAERAAHTRRAAGPPTEQVATHTSCGEDDDWHLPSTASARTAMEVLRKRIEQGAAALGGVSAAPAFYAVFVRLLLTRLVAPTTAAALAVPATSPLPPQRAVPAAGASRHDDLVCVRAPPPPSHLSLLTPGCVLRVPATHYLGRRCAEYLLHAVGGLLRVSAEDAAAAWLDVSAATLRGVLEAPVLDESSTAPTQAARLNAFCVATDARARALHCAWWWCSSMFAHGVLRGWLPHPSFQEARGSGEAAAAATRDEQGKSDFCELWGLGRAEAAAYASAHLACVAARYLHAALARFVLAPSVPTPSPPPSAAPAELMEALRAVRSVAQRAFPCSEATAASLEKAGEVCFAELGDVDGAAAVAAVEFTRVVVHDALFPLAERVLDDPALLQGHTLAFAAPPRTSAPRDGWSADDDGGDGEDGDWAEVSVAKVTPSAPHGGASSPAHATVPRAPGSAGHCTTLGYALDALEFVFGEVARTDSIAVTLRRL